MGIKSKLFHQWLNTLKQPSQINYSLEAQPQSQQLNKDPEGRNLELRVIKGKSYSQG